MKLSREFRDCVGRAINRLVHDEYNERILITLDNGTTLEVKDDVQLCCENRFMTIDDDLNDFVGSRLLEIEVTGEEDGVDDGQVDEVAFLEIKTSLGVISIANHNVHNGYYSGFNIVINKIG